MPSTALSIGVVKVPTAAGTFSSRKLAMADHARSATSDRNLLFGILALQMEFVNRDALVSAMNAWILSKQTPLGVILANRGDLNATRCQLLDALVEEHVKQHDNDAGKS